MEKITRKKIILSILKQAKYINHMTKTKRKSVSYNINVELIEIFNKICDKKAVNKSRLIENYIDEFVKQNVETK